MLSPMPRSPKVLPSTSPAVEGLGLEALEHDVLVRGVHYSASRAG